MLDKTKRGKLDWNISISVAVRSMESIKHPTNFFWEQVYFVLLHSSVK